MFFQVQGDPHPWPRDALTPSAACALIVVDMQNDYCTPGYYIDQAGYDTQRLSEPVTRIQSVLTASRKCGMPVFYTRHGRVPESEVLGAGSGEAGLGGRPEPRTAVRGAAGWQIIPALTPVSADTVIEKSTINAFVSGELDQILRNQGIDHLAFCGNTIDVCVHSTLRAAVDLGYECLLLADCCGAVNDGLLSWAIESVKIENGVFGTVADSQAFEQALSLVRAGSK